MRENERFQMSTQLFVSRLLKAAITQTEGRVRRRGTPRLIGSRSYPVLLSRWLT